MTTPDEIAAERRFQVHALIAVTLIQLLVFIGATAFFLAGLNLYRPDFIVTSFILGTSYIVLSIMWHALVDRIRRW